MEEAEVPLEHLHERVHESAEHSGAVWISWVALSTAVLAVLAAIAGLLSGKHANEAMVSQIEASDQWSYYQAKSIKAAVLDAKIALSATPLAQDREKTARYQEEESEIESEAWQDGITTEDRRLLDFLRLLAWYVNRRAVLQRIQQPAESRSIRDVILFPLLRPAQGAR